MGVTSFSEKKIGLYKALEFANAVTGGLRIANEAGKAEASHNISHDKLLLCILEQRFRQGKQRRTQKRKYQALSDYYKGELQRIYLSSSFFVVFDKATSGQWRQQVTYFLIFLFQNAVLLQSQACTTKSAPHATSKKRKTCLQKYSIELSQSCPRSKLHFPKIANGLPRRLEIKKPSSQK